MEIKPGISDHEAITCVINVIPTQPPRPRHKIYCYGKADFDGVRSEMNKCKEDYFINKQESTSINSNWESLKEGLHQARETFVPSKMSSTRNHLPWIGRKVKRLIRSRNRAHKRAKSSGEPTHWEKFRESRRAVKQELRKQHHRYIQDVVGNLKENPRGLWKYIRSKRMENQGIPTLKSQGTQHILDEDKAQALADQFKSVFTQENLDQIPFMPTNLPSIDDIHVTTEGVLKLLQGLNIHKASGPDDICPRMLKESAEEIAPILRDIFQQSLDSGELPEDWLKANITALYKKGEKALPANYRPVSLTSICSKLLEHIVHSHISRHLESHNILTPRQHGFRKHHSCETQLILGSHDWVSAVDAGHQVDIAIFDFSKAFDTVPHERLKAKLHTYGIRGKLLRWITTFLTTRKQRVIINGTNSRWDDVISGVPQGTVLGPLLFLLYINDITDNLQSEIRLFADDCILYRVIKSSTDCESLQMDIDLLAEWGQKWQMQFNAKKCYVMHMGNKRKKLNFNYKLLDHGLDTVDYHQYLGVYLSHKCKWDHHYNYITKKANQVLGMLRRNLRGCSKTIKSTAYQALVRPQLEYAACVWDPHEAKYINQLEMIQRRSARFVCNNYDRQASVSQMINDLKWDSLQTRREVARLTLMKQIQEGAAAIPIELTPAAKQRLRRTTTGNNHQLAQPFCRTDALKFSYIPRTCRDWNNLPDNIVTLKSLENFKLKTTAYIRECTESK